MAELSHSAGFMLLERMIRAFTGIIVSVAIARHLGTVGYGEFSYVMAFVGLLVVFGQFGTDHLILSDWRNADTSNRKSSLVTTMLTLRIIGATLAYSVILLFSLLFHSSQFTEFWIYGLVLFTVAANVVEPINVACEKGFEISKSQLLVNIVGSGLKIVAVFCDLGVTSILAIYLCESLLQCLGQWHIFTSAWKKKIEFNFYKMKFEFSEFRRALPIVVDSFVVIAYMKVDQILINHFLGSGALGEYSVAVRLIEFTYIVPVVLVNIYNTYIYEKISEVKEKFLQLNSLLFLIAVLGIVGTLLLGALFIRLVYGSEFSASGEIVEIFAFTMIFVFFGVSSGRWLIENKLQKLLLSRNIVGFVSNIGLNLILIPKFGLAGAAYATLIANSISVWVFPLLIPSARNYVRIQFRSVVALMRPKKLFIDVTGFVLARNR